MSTGTGLECSWRCASICATRLGGPVWGLAGCAYACPLGTAALCVGTVAGPHFIEKIAAKCVKKEQFKNCSVSVIKYSTMAPSMDLQRYRSWLREVRAADREEPCLECLADSLQASCFGIFCSIFAA